MKVGGAGISHKFYKKFIFHIVLNINTCVLCARSFARVAGGYVSPAPVTLLGPITNFTVYTKQLASNNLQPLHRKPPNELQEHQRFIAHYPTFPHYGLIRTERLAL